MSRYTDMLVYDLDRVTFNLDEGAEPADLTDGVTTVRVAAIFGPLDLDDEIPPGQAFGDVANVWVQDSELSSYGGLYQQEPRGRKGFTLTRYPDDWEQREQWQLLPGTVQRTSAELWKFTAARVRGLRTVPRG